MSELELYVSTYMGFINIILKKESKIQKNTPWIVASL